MRANLRTVAIALCAALGLSVAAKAATLLSEDFEGFVLGPYVSATEVGKGDGTDWTVELPAGWSSTFMTPLGNPVEFQGWRIHDVDSWIATEGNQDRSLWTRGGVGAHGSVLVVDPDAYDDGTNIDTAQFNASVTTPPIDLSTIVAGTAAIGVDSFFRNEVTSDLTLDVSFDGGANYSNLVTYESDNLPDGAVFDEHLAFGVNNPAAGSLVFRFSLLRGSNDWWWAIDNVEITGQLIPEPSTIALGGGALVGLLSVARRNRRK